MRPGGMIEWCSVSMIGEGTRLGKYLLQKQLGRGGMGTVYQAIQKGLDRPVAVKCLEPPAGANTSEVLKRFRKEMNVSARLSHPNIVRVFDCGHEEGVYFYAMELLRARSLNDLLKEKGPLPLKDALGIARDLCEAFKCYFPQGIVHRDLKPANIMMDENGTAIITDFGLVKDLLATGITRTGTAVGTPYYMSPEMVRGKGVGPASDVYQFGVILYAMLTAKLPFHADRPDQVFQLILHGTARPPSAHVPELPVEVDTLVLNCIAREAAHRYPDAESLSEDLERVARGQAIQRLGPEEPSKETEPQEARPQDRDSGRNRLAGPAAVTAEWSANEKSRVKVEEVRLAQRLKAVAGILVSIVLIGAVGLSLYRDNVRAGYAVKRLRIRCSPTRAAVTWTSPTPYQSRIRWMNLNGVPQELSSGTEATLKHRIILTDLSANKEYRLRILYPDESSSLDYPFRTPAVHLEPLSLKRVGDKWEFRFITPIRTRCTVKHGAEEVTEDSETTEHRILLKSFSLDQEPFSIEFDDVDGEKVTFDTDKIRGRLRETLLPELTKKLVTALSRVDLAQFVEERIDSRLPARAVEAPRTKLDISAVYDDLAEDGLVLNGRHKLRYYHTLSPGDPVAVKLAGELTQKLASLPFSDDLEAMLRMSRGALEGTSLPIDIEIAALSLLEPLLDLDRYAAMIGLPFESGAAAVTGKEYATRYETWLDDTSPAFKKSMPAPQIFATPFDEFDTVRAAFFGTIPERVGPQRISFTLRRVHKLKRAELVLLEPYLPRELRFAVTINNKLKLLFANDPSVYPDWRPRKVPLMCQLFDPRVLQEGNNEIQIELQSLPGTRRLGVKNGGLKGIALLTE